MNDIIVLDVRNKSELISEGKIPKSNNVPFPNIVSGDFELPSPSFQKKYGFVKPRVTDEIIIYCKLGKRASKAATILTELGYLNVKVYVGSFEDWRANGGYVVKHGKSFFLKDIYRARVIKYFLFAGH